MSRNFSFRDLRIIPELSHLTEIDMLHPKHDALVNHFLAQLGFNTSAAILYEPSKHRDMQNKVGVGFRAVGEITQDREFLNSPLCSPIDRVIAASYSDMSLTRELAKLMGTSAVDFRNSAPSAALDDYEPTGAREYLEEDYEEVEAQIKMFTALRDEIRGNPYNDYGSLKVPSEYANPSA